MIVIDYKDNRPIYEQIVEKFQNLILKGVLQENDKIPSVRALAMELSINPNTIQRAYAELEREGFIYTVKGRGNFVSGDMNLLAIRKEEIVNSVYKLCKEAEDIGIGFEEIIEPVKKKLETKQQNGGKHD